MIADIFRNLIPVCDINGILRNIQIRFVQSSTAYLEMYFSISWDIQFGRIQSFTRDITDC